MARFTFIDLFAGIGGMRLAFERVGGECVFTSEWDPFARRTYEANFQGEVFGDITLPETKAAIPSHDILVAGFPCQPFSIAGVSKHNALGRSHGFLHKTQGTLFFDVASILKEHRPAAFVLENVKNLRSHNRGDTLSTILGTLRELDYWIPEPQVLDASAAVPQHRERIFIVGFRVEAPEFRFPRLERSRPRLIDILDPNPDPKYTLTQHLWDYLQGYAEKHRERGNGFGFGLVDPEKPDVVTRTLSARYHKDGSEILIDQGEGLRPRRLTPKECARLMGFPVWSDLAPEKHRRTLEREFVIPVSDTRAYRQFGNSVVVPVVEAVAREVSKWVVPHQISLPQATPRGGSAAFDAAF